MGEPIIVGEPYYQDDWVTIYNGDCNSVMLAVDQDVASIITDPPYGDTSLSWDEIADRWMHIAATYTRSLWCFGSLRSILATHNEFEDAGWRYAQEVVWEKHTGSGFNADRFRRVHELAVHWYRGEWSALHRDVPVTRLYGPGERKVVKRTAQPAHTGIIGQGPTYVSDGTRLERSVIRSRSEHGRALHPTQKPLGILRPLIAYSVPPGDLVLDPFMGSGSTLLAARELGRRAIGIEIDERYCEIAVRRFDQASIFDSGAVT